MLGLFKAAAVGAALLSGVSSSWAQAAPGFTLNKMETIFSFGDSYSAIGYDPAESLTELPLLGGTTSGGLNWIHYLALSNPSTSNSFFDFAGFGATVNNSVVEAAADAPPSFVEQVKTWEEYFVKPDGGKIEVEWQRETSLFTIFFGINDIGFTSLQHLNASDIIPRVVESYGNLVGKLYANGARNFLIVLMPPTWRSPYIRSFGSEMHTSFVNNMATYTSQLEALAASLPSRYPGLNLVTYDTKPLFHAILDNPTAFGFNAQVADSACVAYWQKWPYTEPEANLEECGAPLKEYVWMDEYHPTWTVHKLLAEGVAEALSDPPTVEGDDSLLAQIAAALSAAAEPSPPSSSDFSLPTATDGATPPSAPPLLRKRFRAGSPRRGGGSPARLSPEGEKHHPAGAHTHVHALAQGGKGKPLSRGKWNRARRVRAQEMRRRWSGM